MASLDGSQITGCRTRGTMYDQNCIWVDVGKNHYLLNEMVIGQMANEFVFKIIQKRKYGHLEIDWEKTDEMRASIGR